MNRWWVAAAGLRRRGFVHTAVADEDVQDAYLHVVECDTPEGAQGYAQGIEDSLVNGEITVSGSTVPIERTKATETGVLWLDRRGGLDGEVILDTRPTTCSVEAVWSLLEQSKVDIEAKTPEVVLKRSRSSWRAASGRSTTRRRSTTARARPS